MAADLQERPALFPKRRAPIALACFWDSRHPEFRRNGDAHVLHAERV